METANQDSIRIRELEAELKRMKSFDVSLEAEIRRLKSLSIWGLIKLVVHNTLPANMINRIQKRKFHS